MNDNQTEHCFNRDEAVAFIKKTKANFFVRGAAFLPIFENGAKAGRGFEAMCNIRVSRNDAIQYVRDILSETLEYRGAKITITVYENERGYKPCAFVG